MKQFLVFFGEVDKVKGGMKDFFGDFDNVLTPLKMAEEKAMEIIKQRGLPSDTSWADVCWFHVYDIERDYLDDFSDLPYPCEIYSEDK
jgi:hypothetical protein